MEETLGPGTGPTAAEERFRLLYAAHADGIYAYCLSRLGVEYASAEDLTADVFTVLWRRMAVVPPPPDDRIFLYRIAYRQVKNQRRSLWRRARLQRRLAAERSVPDLVVPPAPIDDPVNERVRSAIAQLPDAQREALLLVVWDGFTHGEAAEILDCSTNAVALRLHKARARLRTLLLAEIVDPAHIPCLTLYRERG